MPQKTLSVALDGIVETTRALPLRWDIPLLGIKNGVNHTFTTPEKFLQTGDSVIRVYRNGQRLKLNEDYTVTESQGPGTGFDQVDINGPALLTNETLVADYLAQTP